MLQPLADGSKPHDVEPAVCTGSEVYTGLNDELLVQLQKDPEGLAIRVKLVLDADSQQMVQLDESRTRGSSGTCSSTRRNPPSRSPTTRSTSLAPNDWQTPVRVFVNARPDAAWENPQTAVIAFFRDDSTAPNRSSSTRRQSSRRRRRGNRIVFNADGT